MFANMLMYSSVTPNFVEALLREANFLVANVRILPNMSGYYLRESSPCAYVVRASDLLLQLQRLGAESPGTCPSFGEFHSFKHLSGLD